MKWSTLLILPVALFTLASTGSAAPAAGGDTGALPFMKSLAGDQELPLPYGVRALYYWQDHGYDIKNLKVSSPFIPMLGNLSQSLDTSTMDVKNEVTQFGLQADAWLLPFLNVYALAGRIDGETKVKFDNNPAAAQLGLQQLDIDYDGFVYGFGATATAGIDPVFVAVNGVITWTDLNDSESSVKAWVIRPIVGVKAGKLSLWTGAMYQKAEENHKGDITIPNLGPVSYDLKLKEKEPWNWIVGGQYEITKEWFFEVEGGFGERTQMEASIGYRF